MPRHKPRAQLALYTRPKHPGTYHYALFLAPKAGVQGPTTKHHVKNTIQNVDGEISQPWRYERIEISDVAYEQRLLARMIMGKICGDREAVEKVLEGLPVRQIGKGGGEGEEGGLFSCRTWVRDAIIELRRTGLVARLEEWEEVETKALEYIDRKKAQGRWSASWEGGMEVPLFDLIENRELVA